MARTLQRMTDSPAKKALLAAIVAALLVGVNSREGSRSNAERRNGGRESKKGRGNVDDVFFKRIKVLIKYAIPSWTCKEAQYMYFLLILLVTRTFLSIWLADVNGKVVKAIVNKNLSQFL